MHDTRRSAPVGEGGSTSTGTWHSKQPHPPAIAAATLWHRLSCRRCTDLHLQHLTSTHQQGLQATHPCTYPSISKKPLGPLPLSKANQQIQLTPPPQPLTARPCGPRCPVQMRKCKCKCSPPRRAAPHAQTPARPAPPAGPSIKPQPVHTCRHALIGSAPITSYSRSRCSRANASTPCSSRRPSHTPSPSMKPLSSTLTRACGRHT